MYKRQVQIKSEKLTPFGGIFSIMEQFDALLAARIKQGKQDKLYLGNLDSLRDWGYAKDYVCLLYTSLVIPNWGKIEEITKQMKNRKVDLITGITGQDGSYLSELLLEKGYDVHRCV